MKICEIVYNLLKGVLPLNSAQKRKLAPKKHILRRLVRPQSVQKRRALLVQQKGGGLLPLLISAAPLLLDAGHSVYKAIKKKRNNKIQK